MESSASMIQEVMDMFPVTTAVNQGENANKEIEIRVSQLNNMLLTKEVSFKYTNYYTELF